MSRSSLACALVLLLGCTPIRPLDAPADAAIDAGSQGDASVVNLDAGRDSGADAGASDASADACYPALPDLCEGTDEDCDPASADGSDDPRVGVPCDGPDSDLCDEGTSSCAEGAVACDDATDDTVEVCGLAGGDEDCDGMVDEDGAQGSQAFYPDVDGDGYGDDAGLRMACQRPTDGRWVTRGEDCDDGDPSVRPGRNEQCNGIDDDCDGMIDDGSPCTGCETFTSAGRIYQVCTNTRTWSNARSQCTSIGYDLAVIGDDAEEMALETAIQGAGGFPVRFWIGLSRTSPDELTWVDGTPVTYTAWISSEPDGSGDCVLIGRVLTEPGWADESCGLTRGYVCELP